MANEGLRPELNGGSQGLQIGWPTPSPSRNRLTRNCPVTRISFLIG